MLIAGRPRHGSLTLTRPSCTPLTSLRSPLRETRPDAGGSVVAVGNFDGVHRGHQSVIERARSGAARVRAQRVVVVTFDPHPVAMLRPDAAPRRLTDIDLRVELLRQAGADDVLVVPFDQDVASWSPATFVDRVLVETLDASLVVVGANFRFGRRAVGDTHLLQQLGSSRGFEVDALALAGDHHRWSSTRVREHLAQGDVEAAGSVLGRPVTLRGRARSGRQAERAAAGSAISLSVDAGTAAPADGDYVGWARAVHSSTPLPALVSVTTHDGPGGPGRVVEARALDGGAAHLAGLLVEVTFVRGSTSVTALTA